jgi:hypothetical protein
MSAPVIQIFPSRHSELHLPSGIDFWPLTNANFRKHMVRFQPQSGTAEYANSWLYLTQACRGAFSSYGRLVGQSDFIAGLGRHNRHWVVVRPCGHPSESFLHALDQLVSTTNARPFVFIKKADSNMRDYFADLARVNKVGVLGASAYRWDRNAPHDDDTFPEIVVSLQDLFRALHERGGPLRRLRSQLRRFELLKLNVEISTIPQTGFSRVVEMLESHFEADSSYVESYINMLRILSRSTPTDTWRHFVPVVEGEPVGLFVYDRIDEMSAGVYASVASKHYPGLGETMMLKLFERMRWEGVAFANLGGSETEGLRNYKRKFTLPYQTGLEEHRYPILVLDFRATPRKLACS